MLSRADVLYLEGRKAVSKSYEYKIKSIIKKKLVKLLNSELPLLTSLFPDMMDLTKFSKKGHSDRDLELTDSSKTRTMMSKQRKRVA